MTADLLFYYHEDIDSLSTTDGGLGLVSRTSPDQEWEAYYPVEYNESEGILTAKNVTELREWAIARVEVVSGVNDPIEGLSEIQIYPNPSKEKINISFFLDKSADLTLRLINMNGQIVYVEECKSYLEGKQLQAFDLINVLAGMYFVELAGKEGVIYVAVVVR